MLDRIQIHGVFRSQEDGEHGIDLDVIVEMRVDVFAVLADVAKRVRHLTWRVPIAGLVHRTEGCDPFTQRLSDE